MKKNLAVYVLYHAQFEKGKEIYNRIYKLLCRDADHPFEDGLDIPVYLRTGDDEHMRDIQPVLMNNTERLFILLLVDDNMYCSEIWQSYIDEIVKLKQAHNDTVHIACVALSEYAFDIGHDLADNQFIRLKSFSIEENWLEFQLRLYDDIIRFIKHDELQKLKIFISHSKKDHNLIGQEKAMELRDYIRSKTKLDSFFDASDILDGCNFEDQIRMNATGEVSLLVILNTNTYSEREWCQKEVLYAKKNKIPTIAVSLIDGEVKRCFPYISNIPYIRYNNNWGEVLVLMLRTALDQFCQKQYLNILRSELRQEDRDRFQILPFTPEAYSYVYDELAFDIIYPEPPLAKEELEVLKKIAGNDKQFLTPMQLLSKSFNLVGKQIAISVSEASDSDALGYGDAMIRDLTVELSRHLLIAGARLLYGGDLRKGGFTRLFSELSLQYKEYQGNTERGVYFFRNFFHWPVYLNFAKDIKIEFTNNRVDPVFVSCPDEYKGDSSKPIAPVNNENSLIWSLSLQKMRQEMESEADARVVLGGRTMGFRGFMPGVIEEFIQAMSAGHPVYLLGGFGGAASLLSSLLKHETSVSDIIERSKENQRYAEFFAYCEELKVDMGYEQLDKIAKEGCSCLLMNGLDETDNKILMESTDVIEIVGLILKGLKQTLTNA